VPKARLGEYLLERGVLTAEELKNVLRAQRGSQEKLGQVLVRHGILSESQLAPLLADFFGMGYLEIGHFEVQPETSALLPQPIARRYNLVPVSSNGQNTLTLAASAPLPGQVVENLRRTTGKNLQFVMMSPHELAQAQQQVYGSGDTAAAPVQPAAAEPALTGAMAPDIVRMVEQIISRAVSRGASDIHLEPGADSLRVRLRVDGILRTVDRLPVHAAPLVISRLKVLAGMNIADRRAPQDGGFLFQYESGGQTLSVSSRVATLPCSHGEKMMLRLLPAQEQLLVLEKLGMEPDTLESLRAALASPNGIILTTGPAGSGKTTTLYAAIHYLRSDTLNIVTIEDPVEMQISGIVQTQVDHTSNKYNYGVALRSILRQDPDIIMVGEIRDGETARLALHAALTGHLVLSTLHTNDTTSTITRLLEMGCEPFLVNTTTLAVLAQRLVRILCPHCRRSYEPHPEELEALGLGPDRPEAFYISDGCPSCDGTGYRGRIGIFELLTIDSGFRKLVAQGSNPQLLREYAIGNNMRTLREDGLLKIRRGITSASEILRVTLER